MMRTCRQTRPERYVLALFQHANVRLRLPVLRWIIPTPEGHHWRRAIDARALDKNFGLPVIDKVFGIAYLPRGERPTGFGVQDPVPATGTCLAWPPPSP